MNATLDEMARQALEGAPGDWVIEYRDRAFDRGWLKATARSLEAQIRDLGLPPGGRIGFVARNRPVLAAALTALIAARRTPAMIYAYQSADALAANVERLDLQAVIGCEDDLGPQVMEAAERRGMAVIALNDDTPPRTVSRGRTGSWDHRPEAEGELVVHLLTSGTTGAPKHHPTTFRSIAGFCSADAADRPPLVDGEGGPPAVAFYPLGNISGMMTILPAILNRTPLILLDRFNLDEWRAFVVRVRPERVSLPPAAFRMILDAKAPREELSSIRLAGTGSAPLDPALQVAFEDTYGIPILTAYGATEFAGSAAAMTEALHLEWGRRKLGTAGRPCPGVQIRVVDPHTFAALAPGEVGLIEVRTARIGPGWIRTTDLGLIDADGFVFLRGRADGVIIRGGHKIHPETIERALQTHPAVSAAVVVGAPDPRVGQVPVAFVQPRPGTPAPEPGELEAHIRGEVYATYVPTHIWIVDELPRTRSLKIDRGTAGAWAERRMRAGRA